VVLDDGPSLIELAERLLSMSGKGFQRTFAGSPVLRTGREGLLRNVCVALGNLGVTTEGARCW
jgi:epoxyqueuosine reductase QueG